MPRGVPELGYRESPDTMERRHPLEIFNNAKFIARYRLDKQFVVDFSQKFAASRFCPVKGLPQGDGIPIVDRVGVFTCYFEFVHQRITFFVKKKCACTFRFVKQMLSILSYKLFFGMFLVFLFFFCLPGVSRSTVLCNGRELLPHWRLPGRYTWLGI